MHHIRKFESVKDKFYRYTPEQLCALFSELILELSFAFGNTQYKSGEKIY